MRASTTGPTAAGRAWCCWSSRCERALAAVRAARGDAEPAPLVNFTPTGRRIDQARGRRIRGRRGRDPALRPLRGRRPALHRRPGRHRAEHRRLRAVRRRDCRRWRLLDARGPAAARRARRRAARTSRTASPPACSTARTTAGPRCWPTAARAPPVPPVLLSGHHAAIERWRREQSLALTAAAPPRPARRGRAPKGASARPTRPSLARPSRKAIISGFSILCHGGRRMRPTLRSKRAHDRIGATPWT